MTTKRKTAGKTATRRAAGRMTHGHGYGRTSAEVREATLMPWDRDMLATALRDVCRIYRGDLRGHRDGEAAMRRRVALSAARAGRVYIPAEETSPALMIRARAAARLAGKTGAAFVADALAAAVDAAIGAAHGAELPYTRHERAALVRLEARDAEERSA